MTTVEKEVDRLGPGGIAPAGTQLVTKRRVIPCAAALIEQRRCGASLTIGGIVAQQEVNSTSTCGLGKNPPVFRLFSVQGANDTQVGGEPHGGSSSGRGPDQCPEHHTGESTNGDEGDR